jgi:hypothetical protein
MFATRLVLSSKVRYDPSMRWVRRILFWTGVCLAVAITAVGILLWRVSERSRIKAKSGCPLITWAPLLPHPKIEPNDYIELNAVGAGPNIPFEPVRVRIYASGLVERETVKTMRGYTFGCPLHEADKTLQIPPEKAQALLAKARDGGFCSLCSTYQYPGWVFDAGTEQITLKLGGRIKLVFDHAGKPPQIFWDLEDQIWDLSNIASVADTRKFSPDREAECEKYSETQERRFESEHE